MQVYHIAAKDGRKIEIIDEEGGSVFPYEDLAVMLVNMGIREYKIKLGELSNE